MNNNYNNNNDEFYKIVDEVKEKADIVSIIQERIPLTKKGSNYIGLCPFHDDKNPSLSVSPSKHIYKCFSCNASGNAITFVQNYDKISFMDALRKVAATVNIKIKSTKKDLEYEKNKKYYDCMKDACDFYSFFLKKAVEAKPAIEYLHNRHLDDEIINHFKIGLSGSDEDNLFKTLTDDNFGHLPIDLVEVGLIRSVGEGKFVDCFRKRIIFPIENLDGNVVGFSGRKYLPNDPESKYYNTTDTVIFKKGLILWNYHEAKEAIRKTKTAYLFEGFMDVIAAYRAGVENAVASMGTNLTVDQIGVLSKIADTIIVCYDGDEPGVNATKRAIQMIMQAGINVKVVSMPDDIDPDEYINANGKEALNNYLLNNTISGLDFFYNQEKKNLDINDINSIEKFKNSMFAYINMYHSQVLAEKYLQILANDLGVSFEGLNKDFANSINLTIDPSFMGQDVYVPTSEGYKVGVSEPEKITVRAIPDKYLEAERQLLMIAYKHIDKVSEIVHKLEYNYVDEGNQKVINHLQQLYITNLAIDEDEINEKLDEDELYLIQNILESHEVMPQVTEINILTDQVKKYSYDKYLKNLVTKQAITNDDVNEIIKHKRKTVIIKKRDKEIR